MGKYALLVVFAGLLGVTVLAQQSQRTALDTSQDQGERQGHVLARQIARSAFNDGISEVKRNFHSISDDDNRRGDYEQGTYTLNYDVSTPDGDREVKITAEGTYRETTYQITGTAREKEVVSPLANGATAGKSTPIGVQGGGCSGAACVSGNDPTGGESHYGISIPGDMSEENVCEEFGDDGSGTKVEGRGDGCSVESRSENKDEWIRGKMENLQSEIEGMINPDNPEGDDVTVCDSRGSGSSSDNCELSGSGDRDGVLYVTGSGAFQFNGGAQWNGPVYVEQGGKLLIDGGGGTRNINGGLFMEGGEGADEDPCTGTPSRGSGLCMNGGNRIQYNPENLEKYFGDLPTLRSTEIQITDRSGQVVRSAE